MPFKINQKLAYHNATEHGPIYQMIIEFEKEEKIVKTLDLRLNATKVNESIVYTDEEKELRNKVETMVRDRLISCVSEMCAGDVKKAIRELGYDPDTGEEIPKTQADYMKEYVELSTPMNLRHHPPIDITSDK